MKKLVLLISIILYAISINAQNYDQHTPNIKPFAINVATINKKVGDMGHVTLDKQYGHVTIPPEFIYGVKKSEKPENKFEQTQGIIIVHTEFGEYMAFERRCPLCYYDNNKIGVVSVWTLQSAICERCQNRMEHIIIFGSGQLTGYHQNMRTGPRYLDSYLVEETYKDGEHYLVIFPR